MNPSVNNKNLAKLAIVGSFSKWWYSNTIVENDAIAFKNPPAKGCFSIARFDYVMLPTSMTVLCRSKRSAADVA